jgi:hypothetical protein
MKIVVIGGTGLIGSKTVALLRQGGHEVVAASPNSGVNTITGEGLKEAVAGAQVVIDLANSTSFEDKAVLEFFETSGRNLLAAEAAANVRHHVALSIVGTDRMPDNGYFRAKVAQEKLIEASGIPYTIIRSTQFMEFLRGIATSSPDENRVRISPGLFQPIAADDVGSLQTIEQVTLRPLFFRRTGFLPPETGATKRASETMSSHRDRKSPAKTREKWPQNSCGLVAPATREAAARGGNSPGQWQPRQRSP